MHLPEKILNGADKILRAADHKWTKDGNSDP